MWKVLVVDDNAVNRELLMEILDGLAVCDTAVNGRVAINKYELSLTNKTPYDIVLLDIAMPEVDGLGFLKFVRKVEAGMPGQSALPIIMVTAFERSFMDAFDNGCDDYILKPIDGRMLVQKIQARLAGKK